MTHLFAAEGGWQEFTLSSTDWALIAFSAITAVLAVIVGFILMKGVLAADEGTSKMKEIAAAIQEGALAYLKRQFRTIGFILIPLVFVVFFTSTHVRGRPAPERQRSIRDDGPQTTSLRTSSWPASSGTRPRSIPSRTTRFGSIVFTPTHARPTRTRSSVRRSVRVSSIESLSRTSAPGVWRPAIEPEFAQCTATTRPSISTSQKKRL